MEQTNTQLESVKQQLTNDNHELLVTKNSLQRECLLAAYVGKSVKISFAKSNGRFSFLMRLLIIGKCQNDSQLVVSVWFLVLPMKFYTTVTGHEPHCQRRPINII